jgi:hypothetical protein
MSEGRSGVDDLIGQGRERGDEQRVAVIGGAGDILRGDARSGARLVLDHDLLSDERSRAIGKQAPDDVRGGAGGETDDQADRTRGVGLRLHGARHGRQRRGARSQPQKIPTR